MVARWLHLNTDPWAVKPSGSVTEKRSAWHKRFNVPLAVTSGVCGDWQCRTTCPYDPSTSTPRFRAGSVRETSAPGGWLMNFCTGWIQWDFFLGWNLQAKRVGKEFGWIILTRKFVDSKDWKLEARNFSDWNILKLLCWDMLGIDCVEDEVFEAIVLRYVRDC